MARPWGREVEADYGSEEMGAVSTNTLVSNITDSVTAKSQELLKEYVRQYYEENQTVILLSAVLVVSWMIWVSTRRTN